MPAGKAVQMKPTRIAITLALVASLIGCNANGENDQSQSDAATAEAEQTLRELKEATAELERVKQEAGSD